MERVVLPLEPVMRKTALYSSSRHPRGGSWSGRPELPGKPQAAEKAQENSAAAPPAGRWRAIGQRHERALLIGAGGLIAMFAVLLYSAITPSPQVFTQNDIDAAVEYTLENREREPAPAARAYALVRPSVVRVENMSASEEDENEFSQRGVGTGVIIEESGVILTNLHVVAGADRVGVRFFDGSESIAEIVGADPENDLAVLQVMELPDDLMPATLISTAGLNVGDRVFAVGNPFDVGVSLSSGVISGMRRNYVSPEGENLLTNLIQFDAAANPGNSGGPLVTEDGEVVGIVTGILNPTEQRVFIGIGFAVPIETAAAAAGSSPF
jgi:S1-C subfamily serine protease